MTSTEKVVLVALDGSPQAMRALPLARTVADQLHAVPTALYVDGGVSTKETRSRLGLGSGPLKQVHVRSRKGVPAEAIVSEARRPEVELLILTTVAGGDPDRALGSVARQVTLNSSRPVLELRPEAGDEPTASAEPLKRLLIPLDGSATTASALRPITKLARRLGASLDVLYIVDSGTLADERASIAAPRYVDQAQHEWSSWEDELKQRLCVECAGFAPGAAIDVHVRQGDPGAEIVRFANEGSYDAIVLVRRSKLGAGLAETLRTVIHHSHCPLLVVGGA